MLSAYMLMLVWDAATFPIRHFYWTVMCSYLCEYDIMYSSGGSFGAGIAVIATFYCVLGRGYGSFSSYRQDLVMLCWPCTYPPTFAALLASDNYWLQFGSGQGARRARLQTHSSHSGSRCQVGGRSTALKRAPWRDLGRGRRRTKRRFKNATSQGSVRNFTCIILAKVVKSFFKLVIPNGFVNRRCAHALQ